MQYDTNQVSNATFNTEASNISVVDHLRTLHQSDISLEICEELALIKNEVANIKNHVFNKLHDDLTPSENGSIHTSLMDPLQSDYFHTEDHTLASNRQDKNDTSPKNNLPVFQSQSGTQDPSSYYQTNDFSSIPSDFASRHRPSANPLESKSNNLYYPREILSNGTVRDPLMALEGNMRTVTTTPNDISMANCAQNIYVKSQKTGKNENVHRKNKGKSINIYLGSRSNSLDPLSHNGLSTPTTQPSVSVPNLTIQSEFSSRRLSFDKESSVNSQGIMKYKEMVSAEQDLDDERNFDDEALDENGDPIFTNHYIKKTLSVIFSTNESYPSTPARSIAQPVPSGAPSETSTPLQSGRSRRYTNSERKEYEEKETARTPITPSTNEVEDYKELQLGGEQGLVSEEDFMGMLYMMKVQHNNKGDLVDKLERLKDLHLGQITKYEKGIRVLNEKNEKINKGNDLLVKTLRTCEKEIDSLASNNQKLHKNILMFEQDMSKKVSKEKQMVESLMQKQKENDKLKDELSRKEAEIQELRSKLATSNAKNDNVKSYARSCEDSIFAIDQTLRKIMPERGTPQVPVTLVYKVIERILTETSKFVEKLDTVSSGSATLETETYKTPSHIKDNGRLFSSFGTEESAGSTYERERSTTRGRPTMSKQKESPTKSSKSSISSSPQPKNTTKSSSSSTKMSKSPMKPVLSNSNSSENNHTNNKVENHILLYSQHSHSFPLTLPHRQRLLNVYADKQQRSVSSNTKKSHEHKTSIDISDKNERRSRSKNNSTSHMTPKKSSHSTPLIEKTPEKTKSVSKKKKTSDIEEEKIKENLRRKVMRSLSPMTCKK